MREIKIDVIKKEIYEVEIKGDYLRFHEQLDCDTITGVRLSKSEYLYVDDEELRRKPLLGAFRIDGYPQALPGHGIIVGLRGPQEVSSRLPLKGVGDMVQFVDVSELPAPVMTVHHFERAEDLKSFMENPDQFNPQPSKN